VLLGVLEHLELLGNLEHLHHLCHQFLRK
jgi:hypothetical protein